MKLLQEHIRMLTELESVLKTIQESPMKRYSVRKVQEHLLKLETDIERFQRLKLSAYEDLREGLLSKEDYFDITEQYQRRISNSNLAREQALREMELYIQNGSSTQKWVQEFIEYQNIQTLTRSMAVECIERIVVYEDKRIEITFNHMQDYQSLVSQVQDYYQVVQEGAG